MTKRIGKEEPPLIPIDEDYTLWVLLNQVSNGMARAREKEVRPFGISAIQSAVMYLVKGMNGIATPTELSKWLLREPNTVSQLLIRMEKQGLVKRVRRPKDTGLVRVALTKKGEQVFRQHDESRKVIHKILSCLSQEEREFLWSIMQRLREKALEELVVKLDLPFP